MYKRISIAIIGVVVILTGFFAYRITLTKFDYNFEKFFPSNDPDTDFFLQFRDKFGTDNDFVLIGIANDKGIFQEDFLQKVNRLAIELRGVTDVVNVVSLTSMNEIIRDPVVGGMTEVPFVQLGKNVLDKDSIRIYSTPELIGSLVSADGKALAILINHTPLIGDDHCSALSDNVRKVVEGYGFDGHYLAGRCVGQSYYTGLMQKELVFFMALSFLLIIVTLFLIYRSFWGVVLPLIMVGVTVIWTLGLMQLLGKDLDMLSTAIPTILVVVGLSVAVHVMTKFFDFVGHGMEKIPALWATIKQVGTATFFTTLTTVVGFGSLVTVGIEPIDEFGMYTALGVAFSFLLSYSLLPALLILIKTPKHLDKFAEKLSWQGLLLRIYLFLIRFKKPILIVALVLGIVSVAGTFQVRENTLLLEDLAKKSPLRKEFAFFSEKFQGTRPFEMAVMIKDSNKTVFDRDVLLELEKMEAYLKTEYGLGFILSPVAIVKNAYKSSNSGDPAYYKIPESEARLKSIVKEIKAVRNNDVIKSVVADDFRVARVRSMLPDIGSNKAHKQNLAFYEFVKNNINTSQFDYKLTGTAELIDKNNRNLALNIGQGLLISFILITIIIAFLFKSWKMVVISLIPNILPMLLMSAIMGIFGISLKISTAILFTIAFGIAVDDTIHIITKLRLELKENKSLMYAIKRAFLTTSKPIIITSILLCAGFLILSLSSFQGTKTVGLLVSMILSFAVIGDLILLPVLLMVFYRKKGLKVYGDEGSPPKKEAEKTY